MPEEDFDIYGEDAGFNHATNGGEVCRKQIILLCCEMSAFGLLI